MNRGPQIPSASAQGGNVQKSQLFPMLMINGYAFFGALFISRSILKALEISDKYWVGQQIFRATNPFATILEVAPGASRVFTGQLILADITLVVAVVLFPLGVLGFGGRKR